MSGNLKITLPMSHKVARCPQTKLIRPLIRTGFSVYPLVSTFEALTLCLKGSCMSDRQPSLASLRGIPRSNVASSILTGCLMFNQGET